MSYYMISGFKAPEPLLKKVWNLLEYSRKGIASSTTIPRITVTGKGNPFANSKIFILIIHLDELRVRKNKL